MTQDFYCDEVLSGNTKVHKVEETENVLAYYHTKPFYEHHIVVIPKFHVDSFISTEPENNDALLIELMHVIKKVAANMLAETGSSKIVTNLGHYQESKHMHWHVISGKQMRT